MIRCENVIENFRRCKKREEKQKRKQERIERLLYLQKRGERRDEFLKKFKLDWQKEEQQGSFQKQNVVDSILEIRKEEISCDMFGDEVLLQGGQGSSLVNQNNLIMCKVKWCNKEIVDDEGNKTI